jgi:hypothetical protein
MTKIFLLRTTALSVAVAQLGLVRLLSVTSRPVAALKRVAIVFLALFVACLCAIGWLVLEGREAVSIPITLQNDFRLAREFQVHSNAHYRIEVRCSRTMPFDQLKQLLQGGNLVDDIRLSENGTPVPLRYFSEFGNLGFAADYISQDIAVFAGHTQRQYMLSCSVVRLISELRSTSPTLVVGLDPLALEGGALLSALLSAFALFFAVVSLVLWAVYLLRIRRARHVQRAEA